jgi:hypothetical protein
MTDAEVDEARAYDIFLGSTSMDEEWLRRHGLTWEPAVNG